MAPMSLSTIGSGIDHPEGVCWDPAGSIVVGTEAGGLLWLDPVSGAVQRSFQIGVGLVAGIAVDGRGRAYACDVPGRRVARVDPHSGSIETWSGGPDARTLSAATPSYTNGMALHPNGGYLYVVESSLPGISRLPLLADGSAGPRELVVEMPRCVPDGIAFTADETLLIACYRPDAVYRWDGRTLDVLVEDWTGLVLSASTNVCFIGDDADELVSANLAGWHITRIGAGLTGARLNYPLID